MKFLIVLRNRVISDMQMIFLVLKVFNRIRADAKFEGNLCAKPVERANHHNLNEVI